MIDEVLSKRRLIVIAVLATAILLALVIAMGGTSIPTPGAAGAITSIPAPTVAPAVSMAPNPVRGVVTVTSTHLRGQTWRFRYTVRATGKTPIGGFQLNGNSANLFNIVGPHWSFYGSGVCGQRHPGLLIYWSTSTTPIQPRHAAHFGFDVNTTRVSSTSYSLSFGASAPQSGTTRAPAPSALRATGPCQ